MKKGFVKIIAPDNKKNSSYCVVALFYCLEKLNGNGYNRTFCIEFSGYLVTRWFNNRFLLGSW